MAVDPTQLKYYLNPTSNSDPNLSLGGSGEGSEIGSGIHALFDRVTPAEASAGDIEYRSCSVKNTNPTDTLYDAVVWISTETSSTDTTVALAYDSTGTQSVVNESTAPSSPALSFSTPTSKATGIALGDMAPAAVKRIWLRRTVTAGAAGSASDAGALSIGGGTV